MPNHAASIQLCVQKLRILIEDSDQNLKYLGLLAMSKILKTHPKSVQSHKDLILACLEDKDESIRLRALDLLYGMVSKKSLMEIVKRLMAHMDKAEGTAYRDELLNKIILICSQNDYQFITNFEWYVSVLIELAGMELGAKQGCAIANQLMDVCIRVSAIRTFAVNDLAQLLEQHAHAPQISLAITEVLYAAAYLVGEFAQELNNPLDTFHNMLAYNGLPSHIQAVFIQNVLKLYARLVKEFEENENWHNIIEIHDVLNEKLLEFVTSAELEVQERANTALVIISLVKEEIIKSKLYIFYLIIFIHLYIHAFGM